MHIIGYIHVCQIGNWQKSYDMIIEGVKSNGLYEATHEIRVGVVNNETWIIDDERFHEPKIVLVDYGAASMYERVTLLHMANYSETDPCSQYWYAHTKGIKYFDSHDEHTKNCVIDWIKLMIHWNFVNWRIASEKLLIHDTYGCEHHYLPLPHYSGNFWWANSHYIKTLPKDIGQGYCDPEFWLLNRENVIGCNIYSSGHGPGGLYSYSSYDEINKT